VSLRTALLVGAGALLLAIGIAIGEALDDGGASEGGTQTLVRTLKPLQLPPARVTVTVTTTR
jgi:hypothetical protein